ncbi:UNVERIFIED_ORG: hypothetical protein GGI63_005273 [Rhizobium esperanzae]
MQGYNDNDNLAWSSRDNDSAHRGRDRRGVRAGILAKEAIFDNDVSNPRVELPYALTKGRMFRVEDDVETTDRLTAADQALWHYLFARGKDHINSLPLEGSDAGFKDKGAYGGRSLVHEVTVGDMLAYLGNNNPARLKESLERIAETHVRYDIRYRRTRLTRPVRYLTIHAMPAKLRSRDVVKYEIDPEVRVSMLMSRYYATVDLNALAKFRSRYSARVYNKLSIMASRNVGLLLAKKNKLGEIGLNKRLWIASAEDLAKSLGYPMSTFREKTFLAAMKKVIAELDALPKINQRFEFVCAVPTEKVPRYVFSTTEASKSVFDVNRAWLGRAAFFHASAHTRPGKRLQIRMKDNQFVHHVRIAQAQAYSGIDGLRLSMEWRSDVEAANAGLVDVIAGWPTGDFLSKIDRFGPEAVFETWLLRKFEAWNAPAVPLEDTVVSDEDAVYYANEDDEEAPKMGDEWGDLGVFDYAA